MKVKVFTVDASELYIADFDQATVMDMILTWGDERQPLLILQMGEAMVYLVKANVVRIDVE